MTDYPAPLVEANHVEPVPRRIRAFLAGKAVVDTTNARYVWEWPAYPQYYIPLADVDADALVDEGTTEETPRGDVRHHRLSASATASDPTRRSLLGAAKVAGLDETVRFDWSAFDAWFEEDEQVFVHPRNPYTRVDAIRSTRRVRVESKGVVLAETSSPVLCFETGLPTRYYLNRTDVDFTNLVPSDTVTAVPTRVRRAGTGRRWWTGGRIPTWPGPTTSRRATCSRSRA